MHDDVEAQINAWIAQINQRLSLQVDEVLHHPEFQRLEAAWRGLFYLVDQTETSALLKIRVLNVSQAELRQDLEGTSEIDQSALFELVYEVEFKTVGGEPYGVLIGDYEFSHRPEDMLVLERMAMIAAVAHAPFIAAASPEMFQLDDFPDIGSKRELTPILAAEEYARWRCFRESDDSLYVGLCLPHFLLRLPYGPKTTPVVAIPYEETIDGLDHSKYLWGNAVYALGGRITAAFAEHGWPASISGIYGGGRVEGLPAHTFRTDEGDVALKCPTEVAISDQRRQEFRELGFIPLVHCRGRDFAAFFAMPSCHSVKFNDHDNAHAHPSTQLQYLLCASRFMHYLMAISRDKTESFMSRDQCERWLKEWIESYKPPLPEYFDDRFPKMPLANARVNVEEVTDCPGHYRVIALLAPGFQLDPLIPARRLVAVLPRPR